MSITEMAALADIHRQSIYTLRGKGEFPAPDDTAVRTRPRWRKSTFDRWIVDNQKLGARATSGGKRVSGQAGIDNKEDDQSDLGHRP
ncbi:helix-turn-helix transcriptional regulator [Candidatus Frankia alpina]|uniref:helix-turn-helix transcriptional regulator n=1 Tax=Candidatus Frankia alpina TaxID=2699483 RepID=UPI0013871B73|nr:helix-turn-helix domain-containing protein [Candidatus Frankia alpina]